MANHQSAKRHPTQPHAPSDQPRASRVRTFIKKVEAAITSGDQAVAREARSSRKCSVVTNGVFHHTISRKISRLNAQIKAMA